MIQIFLVVTISLLVSTLLTYRLSRPGSFLYILDHPNERSLHTTPTPRTGGLAIILAVVCSFLVYLLFTPVDPFFIVVGISIVFLGIISLIDDQFHLSPLIRLACHFVIAVCFLFFGRNLITIDVLSQYFSIPQYLSISITMFFIVWMINLYNFMDGIDGLAGGMAVFGFSSLALIGLFEGHHIFFTTNLIIAISALGFILFNFPPARIFMGDSGSSTLGLLAVFSTLWGIKIGLYQLWIPLLIFSPFLVDATVTLVRRLLQGDRVWLAHKTHYYQHLVQYGFGHKKTVLMEYALMLFCGLSAIIASRSDLIVQRIILVFWIFVYSAIVLIVHYIIRRKPAEDR
jgi:UDP-N-acetylmuramyl pentapeptide phosphotransferase/UDP-N-acetylglucosamine-1-phosphate transferase